MRLAADITIELAGETIHLRPTLRAALRLSRRPGGFAALAEQMADQSLTAMCEVLADHVHMDRLGIARANVWDARHDLPVPLLAYIAALVGADDETAAKRSDASRMTFADYFQKLFVLGTGWLGWSPEQTWNATPAEIVTAYEGRLEMLAAIFGDGKQKQASGTNSELPWGDKFRLFAASRRTTKTKTETETTGETT